MVLSGVLNGQLPAPFQIPGGLAGCALVSWLAVRKGIEPDEIGVTAEGAERGVATGLALGVPLSSIIVGGAIFPSTKRLYGAQHIVEASTRRACYEAFVRIPAGTALPEEVIFRGALPAAFRRNHSAEFSVVVSSILFGLWHIGPALRQSGAKGYELTSGGQRVLHAAASVIGTALAGIGFALLRRSTGSLAAPWVVHAAVNGSGYLAGWFSYRSRKSVDSRAPASGHDPRDSSAPCHKDSITLAAA
jgi:membrane protease YdiL (CAAX protease family)